MTQQSLWAGLQSYVYLPDDPHHLDKWHQSTLQSEGSQIGHFWWRGSNKGFFASFASSRVSANGLESCHHQSTHWKQKQPHLSPHCKLTQITPSELKVAVLKLSFGLGGFAREPKQPPSRKESVKSFPISSLRLTRMHTWILFIQDLGTSENAERVCSVLRDAVTLKKEFFQSHRSWQGGWVGIEWALN